MWSSGNLVLFRYQATCCLLPSHFNIIEYYYTLLRKTCKPFPPWRNRQFFSRPIKWSQTCQTNWNAYLSFSKIWAPSQVVWLILSQPSGKMDFRKRSGGIIWKNMNREKTISTVGGKFSPSWPSVLHFYGLLILPFFQPLMHNATD